MLFKKNHIELILSGKKTQTRRMWKKRRAVPGRIHKVKTQMLSTEYFAEILILRVWKEYLGFISEADAIKEGFRNREHFFQVFYDINKKLKYNPDREDIEVFVVEFKLYNRKRSIQTKLGVNYTPNKEAKKP